MDFHSKKRKQLQALCKKHKIPANLSNLEMANRLTELLTERENQEENVSEIEANDVILNKKAKKVRVSPVIKGISRRNSVCCIEGDSSVEIVKSGGWKKAAVSRRGNAMQTGESNLTEAEVKQKKRGAKVVECAAANSFGDAELEMVDLDMSGTVMSLRGKMAAEGVKNASKRQRRSAKCDEKRDEKASVSANEEIVNNHSRVTRSRAQKLTGAPVVKEKIGSKVVKTIGKVAAGGNRETLSKRGDEGNEKSALCSDERMEDNGKWPKEILVNKQIAGVHVTVESQLCLRRSKRKANMVGESENFATHAPKADVEIIEISGTVESRRRNKRKTMVESSVLRVETENRFLRSPLLQSDIVPEGDVVKNNDDLNCGEESSNRSSRVEVVSAAAMQKSADERNQPHRPDHSSLHHGSSGTEETLLLDQITETRESESSKDHNSKCDEDEEFSLNKLLDEEGKYRNMSQERVNFSSEHSVKDFNEQEMSHASPSLALPTMCNSSGDHEALSAEGGETFNFKNKQSEWTEADISGCLKSHMKTSNSRETNPSTPSSDSETRGNALCFLKSSEENISPVLEGHSPDEYVNHANHGIDKKASAEATSSDVKSCLISKIMAESLGDVKFQDSMETEHQHKNQLAMQTDAGEAELHNLFGTSDEDDHPRLGGTDTCYKGSETTNMSMSRNKSTASNCDSMTKKQEKEMDGGSSHEHAETKDKNVVLPSGFDADICENEFKVLFATPVKIMTPYEIEEACSHGRVLNGSVLSIKKCSEGMKGNVPMESTSNEKTQDAGYEVENKSSIAASLSDNGGDDVCEEINEVGSFELSPTRVSEGEYAGCEALDDQLSQHEEECLDEKISLTKDDREEHAIPLVQSCLKDEETNSPRDLIELESAQKSEIGSCKSNAHNKFEGEMTQSTTKLSNADLQKFDVLEKRHLLTRCSLGGNNLRETLVEASSDPEVAKNGSSEKDMTDTGISPFLCLKVSLDCEDLTLESHDQYEAKRFDEDGNTQSYQDISHELPNNEVTIQEGISIGITCQDQLPSTNELERTCKEANGMETTTQSSYDIDVAEENEPFVCWALSDLVSNFEAGEPTFNLDNGKVQDAGVEHGNNLCTGHLLSGGGEEDNSGKMDDLETITFKFTPTTGLSKTEYVGCEVSQKQLTKLTGECQKETNFVTGGNEERVISLGKCCLFDEEVDNDNESTEEYINSLSGTPNNLDKHEGQDMLIDTAVGESLSCKTSIDHKSEEITQCSEAAIELSGANLQKSNISKNSQDVLDEVTYLCLSPKASAVDNELTPSTNSDDLTGAKVCSESHINSEAGLGCCLELESTFMEMEEAGMTTQDLNITVAPTEHDSPVCTAVSGILRSSEMHLHQRDENSSIKNLHMGKPICMSINNDMKDSEKAEENSTAEMVQFSIEEFHSEEHVEDLKNDEEMDNGSESAEDNVNSLDKHEGCQDMLIVTALGERLCCEIKVDYISEQEMTQCSEAAVELSDVDLQKSDISKNSKDVIDEGTCLLLSSKASTEYNEFGQSTNTNDLNGSKICDEIHSKAKSSKDMPDESLINSEAAILKNLSDSDHQSEEVKLDCCLGLESMFMETKEIGTTTQDINSNVAPTEHGSPAGGSVSSILSSSKMHLHQRDENSSVKNLDVGIDNEKDCEKPVENSTAEMIQVSIQELHFEENVEDFKNDAPTILPSNGYNEILKESDVADAIQEHVDSESSLSVMFENSSISLPSDILSHTDEVIAGFKHEDNVASVDCFNEEIQEQVEAALLLTRPVDFLDEGTTIKLESQRKIETEDWQSSSSKELGSIIKKNARTILIHGTPGKKLLSMADMKENVPPQKSSNAGDITAVRPGKRRALQDLQWK